MRAEVEAYGEAIDIAVAAGQSITISSCGDSVANIYIQTVNRSNPLVYRLLQTLSDGEVTLGPYTSLRLFKISAGSSPVYYEASTTITADACSTLPSVLIDQAATLASMGAYTETAWDNADNVTAWTEGGVNYTATYANNVLATVTGAGVTKTFTYVNGHLMVTLS